MVIKQEVEFRNNSEIFKRLAEVTDVDKLTPEERYHYEADVKNARDTLNQIRGAFQEGEKTGLEKGRAEGLKKGLEKGIRFMLSLGVSPDAIASEYGMSREEVMCQFPVLHLQ